MASGSKSRCSAPSVRNCVFRSTGVSAPWLCWGCCWQLWWWQRRWPGVHLGHAVESALRVVSHVAFAEANLADSPPVPAEHTLLPRSCGHRCRVCFTTSSSLPQSRTLSCWSAPPVVVVAKLRHPWVNAVKGDLVPLPFLKVHGEALAVTRSPTLPLLEHGFPERPV